MPFLLVDNDHELRDLVDSQHKQLEKDTYRDSYFWHGDFWRLCFTMHSAWLVRRMAFQGFLPFGLPSCNLFSLARQDMLVVVDNVDVNNKLPVKAFDVLLGKLHSERCVIHDWADLRRIEKGHRKRAKKYSITVDTDFEGVLDKCVETHGRGWLSKSLTRAWTECFRGNGELPLREPKFHSFELWNERDELVAGEVGIQVGSCYTSLSGFRTESGSGSVQLYGTAMILKKQNFRMWDLGQFMEYKTDQLGCSLLPRTKFLEFFEKAREVPQPILSGREPVNVGDMLRNDAS
mmetsp:Transcript_835/g.3059  ORF Transcript_835/g.3059 Transcript_835/m.3059 type:complete len:291 (-) Transcript_835:172-1044(-)